MKSFIVYDSEGFILRTGSCVDSDLEMQAGDNEFVMEGIADDAEGLALKAQLNVMINAAISAASLMV